MWCSASPDRVTPVLKLILKRSAKVGHDSPSVSSPVKLVVILVMQRVSPLTSPDRIVLLLMRILKKQCHKRTGLPPSAFSQSKVTRFSLCKVVAFVTY